MSLVFAPSRTGAAVFPALAISMAAHIALAAAVLSTSDVAPALTEQSIKGREFIDLAEVEMQMAMPETDAPEGEVAQDSAASFDSPEKVESAKAAQVPVLAQVPYAVDDPDLQFRIANPEDDPDATKDADELATQIQKDMSAEPTPPSTAASPAAQTGRDAQSGSEDTKEGLSDTELAEVSAWNKDLVMALATAKTYPKAARQARAEGKVLIGFRLDRYGRVIQQEVLESSGWPVLDQAAMRLISGFDRLPAPPAAMGQGPFSLRFPVAYTFK